MHAPQEFWRIGSGGAAAQFGLGVADDVDIALAHEDAVVGTDEHAAKGMMPMRRRLAGDHVGGAEMGDHLVARHVAVAVRLRESVISPRFAPHHSICRKI